MSVYQFSLPTKSGELQSLQTYEGKVLIIVKTRRANVDLLTNMRV